MGQLTKLNTMVFLTNLDASKNCFRWYLIEREQNLVNVKWGRMGFQRAMLYPFDSTQQATIWVKRKIKEQVKRGYNLGNYSQLSLF